MTITPSNPFSSRFIRPGAISFVYPEGLSPQGILAKFADKNFRGEIAGPHGSGKTTLVYDLLPLLKQRFGFIEYIVIRSRSFRGVETDCLLRSRPITVREPSLLILDGVEQLSKLQRWALKRACLPREIGLLATVRRPNTWLSTIATLQPLKSTFLQIAEQLQSHSVSKLDSDEFETAFANANGNIREALMSLYDRHEEACSVNQFARQ